MQAFDGKHKASEVVLDHVQTHTFDLSDHVKHLFSMNILHEQKDIVSIVKGLHKSYNIWKDGFF